MNLVMPKQLGITHRFSKCQTWMAVKRERHVQRRAIVVGRDYCRPASLVLPSTWSELVQPGTKISDPRIAHISDFCRIRRVQKNVRSRWTITGVRVYMQKNQPFHHVVQYCERYVKRDVGVLLLTLGAHAQRGLLYLVRLSVCQSVCPRLFSHCRQRRGIRAIPTAPAQQAIQN